MKREAFLRCTPESVGIPSSAVMQLLDRLEYGGFTEMHSLMIMRFDKVCTEGWWAPYAPGLHHVLHSLSKTWTATAVGLAEYAGLLRVTDRVCDLMPELMPDPLPERVAKVTVHDLLTMSCGHDTEKEDYDPGWKQDFFARPFPHEPGTFWFYNTHGTAMLSAIVEKVTGMDMVDWLDSRLFQVIGVDRQHVMCRRDADGTCLGGHGMFTTTEDNLRLMRLYLRGGEWNGTRLLSETFVRDATRAQMDCAPAHDKMPWVHDNRCGYGYQIWMCRPKGAYRADGAYGQFAVVVPDLDLIVSITEAGYIGKRVMQNDLNQRTGMPPVEPDHPVLGPQSTLDALFEILTPAIDPKCTELPPDPAARVLGERLNRLAIPRPAGWTDTLQGTTFSAELTAEGAGVSFRMLQGLMRTPMRNGAQHIAMTVEADRLILRFTEDEQECSITADIRGGRAYGQLVFRQDPDVVSEIACAAWWSGIDTLELSVLWMETENHNRFTFTFRDGSVTVRKWTESGIADPLVECSPVEYRMGGI